MGDTADILGVEKKVAAKVDLSTLGGDGASLHGPSKTPKIKKPMGISREAYALMGTQGLPPLMPNQGGSGGMGGGVAGSGGLDRAGTPGADSRQGGFKQKRASGPARWEWRAFTNSARKDPAWGVLKLHHWQPKDADALTDYSFALLNKQLNVPSYGDGDYDSFLTAPGWTRMETDHLFDLARRLDLRWPVVADRYELLPRKDAAALTARFYDVCARLADARAHEAIPFNATLASSSANSSGGASGSLAGAAAMNSGVAGSVAAGGMDGGGTLIGAGGLPRAALAPEPAFEFDLAYERRRIAQREAEWRRTVEEEAEERDLRAALRKVGALIKKKESRGSSKSVKKEKGGSAAAAAAAAAGGGGSAALALAAAAPVDVDTPVSPRAVVRAAASFAAPPKERAPGVYLRSSRHQLPAQPDGLSMRLMQKMSLVVMELGVPPRPVPTARVCDQYDALRQDIVQLLSLQKVLGRREQDVVALRETAAAKAAALRDARAAAAREAAAREEEEAAAGGGTKKRKAGAGGGANKRGRR